MNRGGINGHLQYGECEYLTIPNYDGTTLTWWLSQLMKYLKLDQKGSIMAEYIWIDGSNGVRSKSKVSLLLHLEMLCSEWNIGTIHMH